MSEEAGVADASVDVPTQEIVDAGAGGSSDAEKTPSKYSSLKRNVFIERRLRYSADYTAICHCEPSSGCDENCLNRAMNYLCGKQCPCGDACTNGSLALRQEKQSRVVWTGESKGWGLVAAEEIKEGEFVIDFRGEVVSLGTYQTRVKTLYANKKDYYALPYDADEVIDAGLRGNDARFINHSCSPNVELRKYQTMGSASEEYELGFWALRDIKGGEEITFNYALEMFPTAEKTMSYVELFETLTGKRPACLCGSTICTGTIGQPQAKLTLKVGGKETAKGRKGKGKKAAALATSATAPSNDEPEKRAGGAGKKRSDSTSRALPPSGTDDPQPSPSAEASTEPNAEESEALAAVAEATATAQADLEAEPDVAAGATEEHEEEATQHAAGSTTMEAEQEQEAINPYEEDTYETSAPVYDVGEPGPSSSSSHYPAGASAGGPGSSHSRSPQPAASGKARRTSTGQGGGGGGGGPASKTAITAILGPPPKFEPARKDAKGVRSIEKHRRKTKYGLLWKSDAELEEERRRRKKGDKWLEEQKAAVRRMHEALKVGDKVVPPPEDPPLPIRSPTAHTLKPRKKRAPKNSNLGQDGSGEQDGSERQKSMEASGSARGGSIDQGESQQAGPSHTTLADAAGVEVPSQATTSSNNNNNNNNAYEIDPALLGEHFALAQQAVEQDLMSGFGLPPPNTQQTAPQGASTSYAAPPLLPPPQTTTTMTNNKTTGTKRNASQATATSGPAARGKRARQEQVAARPPPPPPPPQVYFEQAVDDNALPVALDHQAPSTEDDIAPLPGSTSAYGYPTGFDIYSHNGQY